MIRITQLKLPITHKPEDIQKKAARLLRLSPKDISSLEIVRRSLDARHKHKKELLFVYTVDAETDQERAVLKRMKDKNITSATRREYVFPACGDTPLINRPVIVGAGPAGLFCGCMLAEAGYNPLILERGQSVEKRTKAVERFWKEGVLDPESNVQFGEGGAGTFSDGKLNTLVKDPDLRGRKVLEILVSAGAPKDILYEQKPHLGTDVLAKIVTKLRTFIEARGGEVRFDSRVTDVLVKDGQIEGVTVNEKETIPAEVLVLAPGHSARDTFFMLHERKLEMSAKSFAVGVRVEHPQTMINLAQYGEAEVKELGAASYKMSHQTEDGRGVYTFCMCPGGYVVNASSEEGHLAVNGMSYQDRDGKNANSALIVTVTPGDYEACEGEGVPACLKGVNFQRELEKRAYEAGGGAVPIQTYGDYRKNRTDGTPGEITPCIKGACKPANVREIFPDFIGNAILQGMEAFGKKIPGYDREDALLSGVESRSSSPVRITRDDLGQCNIRGIYPCGEGAGYAGGITSAAMDGIRMAELIAKKYINF